MVSRDTLLNLHGPYKNNFIGSMVKKGPEGPLQGPIKKIFLNKSLDNGQIWIYPGLRSIQLQRNFS